MKGLLVEVLVTCLALVRLCSCRRRVGSNHQEPSGAQSQVEESQTFTDGQKKLLVSLHNKFRSNVKPPANNGTMPNVVWSIQAEHYALNWTKCINYDIHRQEKNDNPLFMGENIYSRARQDNKFDVTQEAQNSVSMWNKENEFYDFDSNTCSPVNPQYPDCGHYTQVVWADSTMIGCAYALNCPDSQAHWATATIWIVCNYKKAGNCNGHRPYSSGNTQGGSCFQGSQ